MGINDSTQNSLVLHYHKFLLAKQSKHREKYKKFKGYFSASTAGSCYRKQYYNVNEYEGTEPDEKSMRLLRLGTIIHKDIADAMESYREEIESDGLKLFVEHQVTLEDFNVVGHLDLAVYDEKEDTLYITDIKSAHSHKWQRTFGRKYDTSPSENYYLQLATYTIGLMEQLEHEPKRVEMSLTWYKKDDSMVRAQKINNLWIEETKSYWWDLIDALGKDRDEEVPIGLVPGGRTKMVAPIEKWECNYCQYKRLYCDGI